MRAFLTTAVAVTALAAGCHRPEAARPVERTASDVRAARRAYDGAPPVIPHPPLGGACTTCHAAEARAVPGVGLAPANPHQHTPGMSAASRCVQCHVFRGVTTVLVANHFRGLPQDLRKGERLYPGAPPTVPHETFLRESCAACHAGAAARPEVKCGHPERTNCLQCHAKSGR